MYERELETEQNCNILTLTLTAITVFLSCSELLNRGAWGPASLGAGFLYRILSPTHLISNCICSIGACEPTLLGAGSLYCILSLTHWTSWALSYIIVQRPPSSCGRHKSHSFNPSTVKVIFWYSSTGCTCYLHWYISYFDGPAGSEVNIQQLYTHGNIKVHCCSSKFHPVTSSIPPSGASGNAEHPFIVIAPRSTLFRNGSTYLWVK